MPSDDAAAGITGESGGGGVTTRRRRRRLAEDTATVEIEKHSNRSCTALSAAVVHKRAVRNFQAAAAAAQTSQARFWRDQPALLVEHVVGASVALLAVQQPRHGPSLLLEEHAAGILSSCRALVKDATTSADTPTSSAAAGALLQHQQLLVAVHGLRAVLSTTSCYNNNNKRDTVIRMLYFCVVTATNPTTCLAAYQGLGVALANYAVPALDGSFVVVGGLPDGVLSFPVPIVQQKSGISVFVGVTAADQLCTMGIAATFAATKAVARLHTESSTPNDCCDFGLPEKLSSDPISVVQHFISGVALPWIATDTELKADHVASHCKKAHRILLDCADIFGADKRLVLQNDAIRALLLNGTGGRAVRAVLKKERNFDVACTSAWKLSQSHVAEQKNQSPSSATACEIAGVGNALQVFHQQVGPLLDSFADKQHPLSYTEYCAYRALHTGACHRPVTSGNGFLELFHLALHVRNGLEGFSADYGACSATSSAKIVSDFRSEHIQNPHDSATRMRLYKILAAIRLHRVVYRFVEEIETVCAPEQQRLLKLGATILADCIGPFCQALVGDVDAKLRPHLWIVVTACLQQAIAVAELDVSFETGKPETSTANARIEQLARILTRTATPVPPPECCKNAAKVSCILCTIESGTSVQITHECVALSRSSFSF